MATFLAGFALSFSLILAIGAQNAFVLRQGLRREHVGLCVAVCAFSDAVLIATGVIAFGWLSEVMPMLGPVLRYGGAAFLLAYGALSFRNAWRGGEALETSGEARSNPWKIVATLLALTWLNPHVYLDTVILIGSIAAQYGEQRFVFGAGGVLASATFFIMLGYGARLLAPFFAKPVAWRILDVVVGLTMWAIAAGLLLKG
ncbi:L-lysine exporter family protein LysE/ArgO [Litoreibacter ponti]|uniref:L-lysine exporter family protein LysE/ArgO n=1 Tax=Litoreibacter ponti TaxID=1510457 RepID=A0A2T6BDE8_9RHOB|nr:LysE/ArgO family amino acid transporter [Litoreibacter ponti]PTX54088.1 L-lysine exporter family protein LysE/ArgO [Litoreibacter ponti]